MPWFRTMGTTGNPESGAGSGRRKSGWRALRLGHRWALKCLLHLLPEVKE